MNKKDFIDSWNLMNELFVISFQALWVRLFFKNLTLECSQALDLSTDMVLS